MPVDVQPDTELQAAIDDTIKHVLDQVAVKTVPKPDPIPSSFSFLRTPSVDSLVEDALSDMSGEFHDLQAHLADFLHIIRQHVITPSSPSSSSDISDWNDLSHWPVVRPRNKDQITESADSALNRNDTKPGSESMLGEDFEKSNEKSTEKSSDTQAAQEPISNNNLSTHEAISSQFTATSSQLTVELFRRAFETGNFSEVEAIMSSYSIESQLTRLTGPTPKDSIRIRLRRNAVKVKVESSVPLASVKVKAESSVPLPSMMVTRNLNEYVPDELPSMAVATPAARRISTDILVVEPRSDQPRPSRTFSTRQHRLLELQVIKHGRLGKPKFKRLSVDTSLGVISWGTGSILMTEIKQIRCGRQTHVLNRKYAAQAYEGLFASIVTLKRTLDIEMRSRTERNQVIGQIQQMVTEFLKAEKNQHVVWNRHDIDNADLDHQIMAGQVTDHRTSRLLSWKSALLKFLVHRQTTENERATNHL